MDDFVIEISEPRRVRHAVAEEPEVYSGRDLEKTVIHPVGDGYKEWPHHFKDTPEGWHDFQTQQAKALDQEPPMHPLCPDTDEMIEERWHVPVTIDGEEAEVQVPVELKFGAQWGKWKLVRALRDQLIEEYQRSIDPTRALVVRMDMPETEM